MATRRQTNERERERERERELNVFGRTRTQTCKVETVKREESFDRNKLFIALQDIYPTQIGTIPFTTEGLAITSSNTKVDTAMGKYVVSRFDNSLIQPNQYVMILLHPDRLSLQPSVNERKFSKFMF